MSTPFAPGEPTLVHMIHQTYLMSWLVQTAGRAATGLLAPPLVGGVVAGLSGDIFWLPLGSVVGVLAFLITLEAATAPMPTDEMVALLGPEDLTNEDEDG